MNRPSTTLHSRRSLKRVFGPALVCIQLLTACGQFQSDKSLEVSPRQVPKQENAMKVDDPEGESILRADEGEDLMAPQTLDQAWDKFQEALELDPNNSRAQFWAEWIKVLREARGILTRVRPIYNAIPNGALRYSRFMNLVDQRLSPSVRRFLLDGPQDMHSIDEFQDWMDATLVRLSDLRGFLKANKHKEFRIRIPSNFMSSLGVGTSRSRNRDKADCESTNYGPVTLKLGSCTSKEVGLNRADLEAMQHMVAYYEVLFTLLNAYRMNPDFIIQNGERSFNETYKLLTQGEAGTLRKGKQRLSSLKDVTADVAVGIQFLIDHERENCRQGYQSKRNRPGYLVETGFCLSHLPNGKTAEEKTLLILEKLIAGEALTPNDVSPRASVQVDGVDVRVFTNVDPWGFFPMRFLDNPPEKIEQFLEPRFDRATCRISILKESGMSPYMVDGHLGSLGNDTLYCPTRTGRPQNRPPMGDQPPTEGQ